MNGKRTVSFIIITAIYILATAVGVLTYSLLDLPVFLAVLIADIVATAVTFVFSLIFSNASVYDPYWSVQPIVIAFAFLIGKPLSLVNLLPVIAIVLWGVRLTANWAYTFMGIEHQDWRYTMLKEKTGAFYPVVNFVGIHLVPTLVVYACVMPVVEVLNSTSLTLNALSVVFFAVSVLAMVLQLVADSQMHAYRKHKATPFIRVGLWKYSRHPNYLGEILMWWGIGLYALSVMPDKWFVIVGAILNTLLFLFVSIPLAEGKQSKKEGYDLYKKQTRALLPVYKKQ